MSSLKAITKNPKFNLIVTLVVVILIITLSVILGKTEHKKSASTQPNPKTSLNSIPQVTLTPGVYDGNNFTLHYPTNWPATLKAIDCGEMEAEGLEISIPSQYKQTSNVISVCVEKTSSQIYVPSYEALKSSAETNLSKGIIDTVSESTIAGKKALVIELDRKKFPGHYEKTVYLSESDRNIRISWSINTTDNATKNLIIKSTEAQFNDVLSSLIINKSTANSADIDEH